MNIACKTLVASFLLMFTLSAKGAAPTTKEVHGTLHLDINLDVPSLPVRGKIDDIQWKKGDDRIIRFTESKITHQTKETYQVFENATLKIKRLQMNDSGYYTVFLYDVNGKQILSNTFNLKVLERVSKPVIYWSCTNTTVTCEVTEGTDPQLTLYRNRNKIKEGPKVIVYQWTAKPNALFNCTATNKVSKDSNEVNIRCPGTWQALARHPKFTSQTQPARPRQRPSPGPQCLGWEAALVQDENTPLPPETFKGRLRGERRGYSMVIHPGILPQSTINPQAIQKIFWEKELPNRRRTRSCRGYFMQTLTSQRDELTYPRPLG